MTDLSHKGYLIALKDNGEEDSKYTMKTEEIYIGGGVDCDIRLRNGHIIGRRCIIKLESSNRIIIQSLNKEHPVLVNNKELNDGKYVLKSGDIIGIFNYNFRWENPHKSDGDKIDCGHTSLIVGEIENEEQRRFSAPSRLKFENAGDIDTFNIENGTTSFIADHEKKNPSDPNALKNLTKTSEEGCHILEHFGIPQGPCFVITPEKNEFMHAEQYFGEKTSKSFGESYHSTPKVTTDTQLQKNSSNDLIDNLLGVSQSPVKLRDRRSTGMEPFVGTPSNVYHVTGDILTPASRPRPNAENESCIVKFDLLASGNKFLAARKSTPLKSQKSDKSINRESIMYSSIIEDYAMEKIEENQNESGSKYKFVASRRRRHLQANSFAIENRIDEEIESSRDDELNGEHEDDREGNFIDSISGNSQESMSAHINVNGDTKSNLYENSEVDSTYVLDESIERSKDTSVALSMPKSILTPLPKTDLFYKEKSAKKLTFARSLTQKSLDQSIWNSARFKDNCDSLSNMFNISSDAENASLETSCRNEELYLIDQSQSEISISMPCNAPVKGKRILMTRSECVPKGPKTPSQVSSCSIGDSVSISTNDVDLTVAEKMEFMKGSNYDVSAALSVSNNATRLSRSVNSFYLEESNVRESALSNDLTGSIDFTNSVESESGIRQSTVSNNLKTTLKVSENSIFQSAESNSFIPTKSNSMGVEKNVRQYNNLNSASKSTNKSKIEMFESGVRQSNSLTSASKSMNVSTLEFENSVGQSAASNTLSNSKSLKWSTIENNEAPISSKNRTTDSKFMNVSTVGEKYIICQTVLSNDPTPTKSMQVSNIRKRENSDDNSVVSKIFYPESKSMDVSILEESASNSLQIAVSSNNVAVAEESIHTSNQEEQNISTCHAAMSNILASRKSMNLSTIEQDEASTCKFVVSVNSSPSKLMNLVIEEEDEVSVSELAVLDHESNSKSVNVSMEEEYDTSFSESAASDNLSPNKSMDLSIIEVGSTISEPDVTSNLTISNESVSSFIRLPTANVSVIENDETVIEIQDISSPKSPKDLSNNCKTEDASESTESVIEKNRDSVDVLQIIVTEFLDSNENTVSVEHSMVPIEQDQEGPAPEKLAIMEPTIPVANYENVSRMKRSCEGIINYDNVERVQHLINTPRQPASSYEDFKSVQELTKTSKISGPGVPENLLLAEKSSPSYSVIHGSKIMGISQAGLPPSEYKMSSKSVTSYEAGVSNTCEAEPSNDSEITSWMKSNTDFYNTHASTLLPCTSTPHQNIKNFLQQNIFLQNENQLVSDISGVCPSSVENEIDSQTTCNQPNVAMLESDRLVSMESIRVCRDKIEFNANVPLKLTTHSVNTKNVDNVSQPTSQMSLIHTPTTYEDERLKEDVIPVTKGTVGTQEAERFLEGVNRIFIKPAKTILRLKNAEGMRKMFRTPSESTVSYENVEGVKHMFMTPAETKSSYENVTGVKQMFRTPAELKSSYDNVSGMKKIFKTSLQRKTNYGKMCGMEELLRTSDEGASEKSSFFVEGAWRENSFVPETAESFITVVPKEINGIIDGIKALPESPTCWQDEGVTDAVSFFVNKEATRPTVNSTESTDNESEKEEGFSENRTLLNLSHRKVVLPRTDFSRDPEDLSISVEEVRSSSREAALFKIDAAVEKSVMKRSRRDLNDQENENIFNKVDERIPIRRNKRILLTKRPETTPVIEPTTTLKKFNISGINKVKEKAQAMTQVNEQASSQRMLSVHLKNIENVYTLSPMKKRSFKEFNDDPVLASSPTTVTRPGPFPIILAKTAREKHAQILLLEEATAEWNENAEPFSKKIRVWPKKVASKEDFSRAELNNVVTRNVRRISSLRKNNKERSVKVEVILSLLRVPSKRASKKIQVGVKESLPQKQNFTTSTSAIAKTIPKRNLRGKSVQRSQREKKTESSSVKPKRATRSNRKVEKTVSHPESSQPKSGKAKVQETVPQLKNNRPRRSTTKVEESTPQLQDSRHKMGKAKVEESVPQLENSRPKRGKAKVGESVIQLGNNRPKRGKAKVEESVPQLGNSRPKRGRAKVEETMPPLETSRPKRGKTKIQESVPEIILSTRTKAEVRKTVETKKCSKKTPAELPTKKDVTRSRKPVKEESPATNKRVTRKRKVVETPESSRSKMTRGKRRETASDTSKNKHKLKRKKNETATMKESINVENGNSKNIQNVKWSRKSITFKTKKRKSIVEKGIVEVEPRTKGMKKMKSTEKVKTIDGKSSSTKKSLVETAKQHSRIRVSVSMKVEAPARVSRPAKNTKSATYKTSSTSQEKVRFSVASPVMRVTRCSTTRDNFV